MKIIPYRMKPTHFYVIRTGEYYKIGMAVNFQKRLHGFESYSPYEFETVIDWIFQDRGKAAAFEAKMHRQFEVKRVRGEWFLLSQADIEVIKKHGQ